MGMTRLAVRTLVRSLVDFAPETYITSDAEINVLINERLDAYAIQAKAFVSRSTALIGPQTDPGPYSIDLRAFSAIGLTNATDVWVNGTQLADLLGRPGPCSSQSLSDQYAQYLSEVPGTVKHWSPMGADRIEIWPAPAIGVSLAILGTSLHGALNDDVESTRFPTELDRPFCFDVAAQLLLPRANGETLEKATGYATLASEAAQAYAERSESTRRGRVVRGGKRRSRVRIG